MLKVLSFIVNSLLLNNYFCNESLTILGVDIDKISIDPISRVIYFSIYNAGTNQIRMITMDDASHEVCINCEANWKTFYMDIAHG